MLAVIGRKLQGRKRALCSRILRRFGRREDGAAAVEFAMVAAPFFAVLFAIMETAAADSSRLIFTGEAQQSGFSQQAFKEAVCGKVFGIFDCANKMTVDVQKYTSFSAADFTRPVGTDGKVKPGGWYPGGPCDIVVVRLIYEFPVYVSLLGFDLHDMNGNKRLLVATSVFRNEPYSGTCS